MWNSPTAPATVAWTHVARGPGGRDAPFVAARRSSRNRHSRACRCNLLVPVNPPQAVDKGDVDASGRDDTGRRTWLRGRLAYEVGYALLVVGASAAALSPVLRRSG